MGGARREKRERNLGREAGAQGKEKGVKSRE